jgi:hypothetical protein
VTVAAFGLVWVTIAAFRLVWVASANTPRARWLGLAFHGVRTPAGIPLGGGADGDREEGRTGSGA